MAHSTLPVLAHPDFPQVFKSAMNAEVRRIVQRVDRVLGSCCFPRCQAEADLCDMETGCGYCRTHFREVDLG
jgi:hypothetical protein